MSKPNCYKCVHRGTVPGSCHSSCNHPKAATLVNDPMVQFAAIMGKRSGLTGPLMTAESESLNIEGHPRGIAGGWFLWPVNFDPVWLVNCDGFEPTAQPIGEVGA